MGWAERDRFLEAKLDYLKNALQRVHAGFTDAFFETLHRRAE